MPATHAPARTVERLVYADADTSDVMARDASACSAEAHLARALGALGAARRTVEQVPSALLVAPKQVARSAVSVTDSAAKFAGRLFD